MKFIKRLRTKHRILTIQILILVFPIIICIIFLKLNTDNIKNHYAIEMDHSIELLNHTLDNFRSDAEVFSLLIAQRDDISLLVNNFKNEEKWDPDDEKEIKNYPSNTMNYFTENAYNDEIVALRIISNEIFSELSSKLEYIENIEIVNKNSVVVMRGHRDYRGDTKSDNLILSSINGSQSPGTLISKRTGYPAIDGSSPIYYDNEVVGAVKIGIYMTDYMLDYLNKTLDVDLILFDKNSVILSTVDNISSDLFYKENGKMILDEGTYNNLINNNLLINNLTSESKEYSFKLEPIINYDGKTVGAIGILRDNYSLNETIKYETLKMFLICLILIIPGLLGSIFLSRRIVHPLMTFSKSIKSIEKIEDIDNIHIDYAPKEILDLLDEFKSLSKNLTIKRDENIKLLEVSNIDGLTQLFNHRYFYEKINKIKDIPFLVMFIDIDYFKKLNDKLGHTIGDQILKEIAIIINSEVGNTGSSYRYGGEEFTTIIIDREFKEGYEIAESIRKKIESSNYITKLTRGKKVTVSIGISSYPHDSLNKLDIVKFSDEAMYYSKNTGRNKSTIYDDALISKNKEDMIKKAKIKNLVNSAKSLIAAVDAKDNYTRKHSFEVQEYTKILGLKMNLDKNTLEKLNFASLLHDVGKVGVEDRILKKPGKLTDEEYDVIKAHPLMGSNIARFITKDIEIINAIKHHHERWDGFGYPDGLKEDKIPLLSRIISVADTFHALISNRPYRKGMSIEDALIEISKSAGTQLDPEISKILIEEIQKL